MAARSWAAVRLLYLQACGDTPRARLESWDHLAEAQRLLAASIDVPELNEIDDTVVVASGADYVTTSSIDYSVYAVLSCFNKTSGIPMYPEPSGMIGRRSYLQTTGKPAAGTITHYQRDGSRLYVRGTAEDDTTIQVRVQRQMPNLSDADATGTPITPQHYDRAIVHKAAELYFLLHPNENQVTDGERSFQQSSKHRDAYRELATEPKSVRAEEDRPRQERFRLTHFRLAPRSRRGR
jgi:hypothetical protein